MLTDDMGLGKTLAVASLVCLRPQAAAAERRAKASAAGDAGLASAAPSNRQKPGLLRSRKPLPAAAAAKAAAVSVPAAPLVPSTRLRQKGRNAFMFFTQEARKTVAAEHPGLGFGELGRELGRRWRNMDSAAKRRYEALAVDDMARARAEASKQNMNQAPAVSIPRPIPSPESRDKSRLGGGMEQRQDAIEPGILGPRSSAVCAQKVSVGKVRIQSRATLVVAPVSLLGQWKLEFETR